ncbi:MAG: hypothetical protein J7J36_00400 [Thermoplasmata archaeon]|nr:hypothetical protein [Thermoplasmata archaeon]
MKKFIVLLISIAFLLTGFHFAYEKSKILNESRCLGCIAMLPKAISFHKFWIEYPKNFHKSGIPQIPSWLLNESKKNVVMLFFWYKGCDPCKAQWDDMVANNIVSGSESNGKMTGNFSNITLISIDIINDKLGNLLPIYTPKGKPSETPTTVILFTKNETYWYAFSGKADGIAGRPNISQLKKILNLAMEEKNVHG